MTVTACDAQQVLVEGKRLLKCKAAALDTAAAASRERQAPARENK